MNPTTPQPYAIDYTGSGLDPKLASGGNYATKDGVSYNAPTFAPSSATPAVQPASPVTALSSSNGASAIDQHIADHSKDVAALSTYQQPNNTPAPTPATPTAITAAEAQAAGVDLTKYTYDPATKTYSPSPLADAAGSAQYESDKKAINDAFASQIASMDSATAALMASIHGIYSARIADQQEANRRELATFNTGNVRFGTDRYAPGTAAGILTADERVGLDRINKIATEEANMIAQANQSLQDKKYAAFVQQRNELASLRKERLDTLTKLKDDAYKAQQDKIKNDLDAKIHSDTVSYQDKQLAIQQAQLDETVRKDKAAELQKAADLKIKQDAANLISGAMTTPVVKTNGVVNPADQQKFLSAYTPLMQTTIKGIADYSIDPNAASKRAGVGLTPLQLETIAKAYNPDYRAGQYQAVSSFLKSWASGGNNSVVQSANTVVQHFAELANDVDKLGNVPSGSLGPFTTSYNNFNQWLNEGKSNPAVYKYKQTAVLVATELAKIMKNGSGSNAAPTTEEIDHQLNIMTAGLSPDTAKALIENGISLMGDRLNTARENYANVVGVPPNQVLFPSAKAALEELKGKGYNVDLSSLDPSPLANVSDADLITGIASPSAATSTPSQYFNGLLDIINAPAPADATQ